MGRSVLPHPDAEVTAYTSWAEHHISMCQYCDEDVKYDYAQGWVLVYVNEEVPGYCAAHLAANVAMFGADGMNEEEAKHEGYDYDSDDFENDLEWFQQSVISMFRSMREADRWVGNEVHVVAENDLAEVSVSEYCGLVALCIAPKTDEYGDVQYPGLAKRWIDSVSEKFLTAFGDYAKLGTFSNGESVYTPVEKGDGQ